MNNNIYQSCY